MSKVDHSGLLIGVKLFPQKTKRLKCKTKMKY